MSEIQKEVMATAMRALMVPEPEMVDSVASAILAERRRCAEVARHLNGWGPVGGNVVAEHIAKVIEAGPYQ